MKKMDLLKLFVALLAFILFIVACSNQDDNNDASNFSSEENSLSSDNEDSDQPVSFSAFMPQHVKIENMDTNWYTNHVEEMLNINIEWELAPSSGATERKQLLLASGDYPDVFLNGMLNNEEQLKYGLQGVLTPLNDLIEEHGPNIKKAMEQIEGYKQAITTPDGNIYALPMVNQCYHCTYSTKMIMNTKWLENLNLDIPTTTEEFYQVLKAFKEDDPNQNGVNDEMPLAGHRATNGHLHGYLMNAFIYTDVNSFLRVNDGTVEFVADKPEFREGLVYLNKLYSEELIDPTSFTQDGDSIKQFVMGGDDARLGAWPARHPNYPALTLSDEEGARHRDYRIIPPIAGPSGAQYTTFESSFHGGHFAITNKASEEQAIAAIKLADYMTTEEGTILAIFGGPEGEYWRKAEEDELDYYGEPAVYTNVIEFSSVESHNNGWEQHGPTIRTFEFRESFTQPQDELSVDGYEIRLHNATIEYEPHAPMDQVYPIKEVFVDLEYIEDLNRIKTTLFDFVEENIVAFITGNRDIDLEWENYVSELGNLNLSRYIEIYQDAYDNLAH